MFQSLRYYSALFLVAAIILVATFIVYAKYTGARTMIQKTTAEYADLTERYFQHQIWERYFPIINFIHSSPEESIATIPAYILLQEEMNDLFKRQEVADVVLLNNDKIVFELLPNHKVQDILKIEPGNSIVKKRLGSNKDRYFFQTFYIPSLSKLPASYNKFANDLEPKLVVYYDIDKQMRKLNLIVLIGSIIFIILSAVFVVYIYIFTIRTEKILEKGGVSSLQKEGGAVINSQNYEEKAAFYDNINHELRTPLNAIIGFSELVKNESMGPLDNPQYKDFAETIYEAGNQLLMLIDDIQDFAKAGENKLTIANEEIDITKMSRLCIQMIEVSAADKGVEIKDELGEEHYVIMADPHRIKQVILNLLKNAVKFSEKNGEVALSLKLENSKITLEIKDNGKGMTPDNLRNSMIPFGGAREEQDGIKVQKKHSTGLGLPLTKKLIELMGGEFDITSEVDLGTKARLIFNFIKSQESGNSEDGDNNAKAVSTAVKSEPTTAEEESADAKSATRLDDAVHENNIPPRKTEFTEDNDKNDEYSAIDESEKKTPPEGELPFVDDSDETKDDK